MRKFGLLILLLIPVVVIGCRMNRSYPNEPVPKGSMETRHAWGQKKLGPSYIRTAQWLKSAKFARDSIGEVIATAPTGEPNSIAAYFTDGAMGNLTIEVKGQKGTGVFTANNIHPDSTYPIGFHEGRWTVDGKTVEVHPSGLTIAAFNLPENRIADATLRISNAPPDRSIMHGVYKERAEAYADLGDYEKAVADMTQATKYMEEQGEQTINVDADGEHKGWNHNNAEQFREYLRQLALYQTFLGDFPGALNSIWRLENSAFFPDILGRESLRQFILMSKTDKQDRAAGQLRSTMERSIQNGHRCWIPFARFLLGELTEEQFLDKIRNESASFAHSDCGNRVGDRTLALALYYAAELHEISGDSDKANLLYQQAIDANQWNDSAFEMKIARWKTSKLTPPKTATEK